LYRGIPVSEVATSEDSLSETARYNVVMKHDELQSPFKFRMMALEFRLRDLLKPPEKLLRRVGLAEGMTLLDYGCGPGGYALAGSRIVGPKGRALAVDVHPEALSMLNASVRSHGIRNIRVMMPNDLASEKVGTVDMVLFFDVLHELSNTRETLELVRGLMRPSGRAIVRDHHMTREEVLAAMQTDGFFCSDREEKGLFMFALRHK
jgi:ubiquinone/menaquinone biosynthesis C-methylase UbiE